MKHKYVIYSPVKENIWVSDNVSNSPFGER